MKIESIPENIADIDKLAAVLRAARVGDVVAYFTLEGLVAGVQRRTRYKLDSALRKLLKEDRIVFGCVHNEGIKRLNDSETAIIGDQTRRKIGSAARRGMRKMSCAKPEAMKPDERNRMFANQSLLGAMSNLSRTSAVKDVEKALPHEHMKLMLSRTIEAFK